MIVPEKKTKIALAVIIFVLVVIGSYFVYLNSDHHDYKLACQLRDSGEIDGAILAFAALGDFKDSRTQIQEIRYQRAEQLYESGNSAASADSFLALNDYGDSMERYSQIRYNIADSLATIGNWPEALNVFDELGGFSDSEERVLSLTYQIALTHLSNDSWEPAYNTFRDLEDYENSNELADSIGYLLACHLLASNSPTEAGRIFDELGNYRDSQDIVRNLEGGGMRFMIEGRVITDCLTGLEWMVGRDSTTTWFTARNWVQTLPNGWRMPSVDELEELYNAGIDQDNWGYFENSGKWVWSGEVREFEPNAYLFQFDEWARSGYHGQANPDRNYDFIRAFAVRDPNTSEDVQVTTTSDSPFSQRFSVSGEVITDTETGLEWRVGPDDDTSWNDADRWVSNLGGSWRLPRLNELRDLYESGINSVGNWGPFYTGGYQVWSSDQWWAREGDTHPSQAYYFDFYIGDDARFFYSTSWNMRAFAVR